MIKWLGIFLALFSSHLFSDMAIDGTNNHWGATGNFLPPIQIGGVISIPEGIELKIDAGTTISLLNSIAINLQGKISAIGTADKFIEFKPVDTQPAIKDWISINVYSSEGCVFKFCHLFQANFTLNDDTNTIFQNCTFFKNISTSWIYNSNPMLINNTFYSLPQLYAIRIDDAVSNPIIRNNIFTNYRQTVMCDAGGGQAISYNISNGFVGNYSGCDALGVNNLYGDPLLVDPENGDFHLQSNSPAIDAGDPADNYSLEPNGGGGRINMGAYGNTPEAATGIAVERKPSINAELNNIAVYPNPFRPITKIMLPKLHTASVSIINPSGQRVAYFSDVHSNTLKWNAGHLPNGLYVIKAHIDGQVYSKKVLLQK